MLAQAFIYFFSK